jgi:hypothetical protein
MLKGRIFKICFLILILTFCLHLTLPVQAEKKDCNKINIATEPGNADYNIIDCCAEATPTIVASNPTIAPSGSITLKVDSGGLACPIYSWSSSDGKYTFNKGGETEADLEEITLTAASGSCGSGYSNANIVCTVTVTDICGRTDEVEIRNTAGGWVWVENIGNEGDNCTCTNCYDCGLVAEGKNAYNVCLNGNDSNYTMYGSCGGDPLTYSNNCYPNNPAGEWCYENPDLCIESIHKRYNPMNCCQKYELYPNSCSWFSDADCSGSAGWAYTTRLIRVYEWGCP